MHEPGHHPLAGPRLPLEQQRGQAATRPLGLQELAQLLPDGADGRALAEQFLRQRFHGRR